MAAVCGRSPLPATDLTFTRAAATVLSMYRIALVAAAFAGLSLYQIRSAEA
jgi:hypothetical protein